MTVRTETCKKCGIVIRGNGATKFRVAKKEHNCLTRVSSSYPPMSNEIVIDIRLNGKSLCHVITAPKHDNEVEERVTITPVAPTIKDVIDLANERIEAAKKRKSWISTAPLWRKKYHMKMMRAARYKHKDED